MKQWAGSLLVSCLLQQWYRPT